MRPRLIASEIVGVGPHLLGLEYASMRPRLIASEIECDGERKRRHTASFNEAEADRLGNHSNRSRGVAHQGFASMRPRLIASEIDPAKVYESLTAMQLQ